MQRQRHVVDGGNVGALDDRVGIDIAHESDLRLNALGKRAVGAQDQRVRRDANRSQCADGVLRRLCLQLSRRGQERNERDVHEGDVRAAEVVTHLAGRLQERL